MLLMWVKTWCSHANEGHAASSCGHPWLVWQCCCWVASQEQGLTKSFLALRQEIYHKTARQLGKRTVFTTPCTVSAAPVPVRSKGCAHVGRRLLRWGCKIRRKILKVDPLGTIGTYFLCCNTTCRPSTGLGVAEEGLPCRLRGSPSPQAPRKPSATECLGATQPKLCHGCSPHQHLQWTGQTKPLNPTPLWTAWQTIPKMAFDAESRRPCPRTTRRGSFHCCVGKANPLSSSS